MRIDLALKDYIGDRSEQQDSAGAQPLGGGQGHLLVIADGLGGHRGGATASRIAIETYLEAAREGDFDNPETRHAALLDVLERTNHRIHEASPQGPGAETMGTTLVAVLATAGGLEWISVGDSHLYLWRDGTLDKLNDDHSQAALMVKSGRYHPDDPEVLRYKSLLRSAVTGKSIELIDHPPSAHQTRPGDIVLLATDGVNTVDTDTIASIITSTGNGGASRVSHTLLAEVQARATENQDNATVVVARLDPAEAEALPRTRPSPAQAVAPADEPSTTVLPQTVAPGPAEYAPPPHAPEFATPPPPAAASPLPVDDDGSGAFGGRDVALLVLTVVAGLAFGAAAAVLLLRSF